MMRRGWISCSKVVKHNKCFSVRSTRCYSSSFNQNLVNSLQKVDDEIHDMLQRELNVKLAASN